MILLPNPRRRPSRAAFTLLELLVSMTILSLLLVLLLSMVNGATRLWKANENRVDSYREARAAINVIASDLSSLYASTNLTYFSTQEDPTPATPSNPAGMDGRLFFLTALPSAAQDPNANKSDLCTVGYFLAFNKTSLTGKGTPSYNLYRYLRSSDPTFTALQTGDLLKDVEIDTSPTAVSATGSSEVLAKNITGFKVVAYTIPYTAPVPPSTTGTYGTPVAFEKTAATPLPDMLEITVKALNNDTAKRFSDKKSDWENKDSLARKQEERSFTTRIYLAGAAQVKPGPTPTPSPSPSPTPNP